MHTDMRLSVELIYRFLFVLARVAGVVVFAPLPGIKDVADSARVVLAMAITVMLLPGAPAVEVPETISKLAVWALAESATGLLIGICLAIVLDGIQMAAQMVGVPAGFSYAATIDPSTQADVTALQMMTNLFGGLLFFALGFDRVIFGVLAKSFYTLPPGVAPLSATLSQALIRASSTIFVTGFRLALPVLALLLLLDLAVGVVGRVQAQLQLLSLAFPLKMMAGLFMLIGALALYPKVFDHTGQQIFGGLEILLHP